MERATEVVKESTLDIMWLDTGETQKNVKLKDLSLVVKQKQLTSKAELEKLGWGVEWRLPTPVCATHPKIDEDTKIDGRERRSLYAEQPDSEFCEGPDLMVHSRRRDEDEDNPETLGELRSEVEDIVRDEVKKMRDDMAELKEMMTSLLEQGQRQGQGRRQGQGQGLSRSTTVH
jgi:hypothetical protein